MYSLPGQEKASDGGCLFVVGGLLLLTLISLLPLLLPNVASAEWYGLFAATTDILLFLGLFLFIVSFSDTRTKYLLSFILLSCILLQISLYQTTFHWPDPPFLPAIWSIRLRVGYALFLVCLFLFTTISHYQKERKTRQNISESSLAVSEQRVTIGTPFVIIYTFSTKQMTQIDSLNITFSYQQFVNRENQPYKERSIPVYQKKDCTSGPTEPLVETFEWTIPAHLLPEDGTRKDWKLNAQVKLHKGVTLYTTYFLKVIWVWPENA